jgi:beta-N-acetylhexosaminidase
MPAHIVYEQNDPMPAGFSPYWIQTILRERLGFQGAVLSDDLSMQGAAMMGDMTSRAEAALAAGCDMILVCNKPESAIEVIDNLSMSSDPLRHARLVRLHGRHGVERDQLLASQEWKQAVNTVLDYAPNQELELDLS